MRKIPDWLPQGGHSEEGGSEYVFECPSCGGSKFFWNISRRKGFCFHCKVKVGSAASLHRLLGLEVPEQEKASTVERRQQSLQEVSEKVPVWGTEAEAYLITRKVRPDLAAEIGMLYEPGRRKIHAPIWSPVGLPRSFKSRSVVPGEKGWMSRSGDPAVGYLFGDPPKRNPVLVEGVFDVLTPGLWGTALALLGSMLYTPIEWWIARTFPEVTLLLDPDAVVKAKKIEHSLVSFGVRVWNLTGKFPEPGECINGELDFLKEVE